MVVTPILFRRATEFSTPRGNGQATALVFNRSGEILIEYDTVLTAGRETFGRAWVSAATLTKLRDTGTA